MAAIARYGYTPEQFKRREQKQARLKQRAAIMKERTAGGVPNVASQKVRWKIGLKEYWMIGYDGPSPSPPSAWSKIIEHAQRYGL